MQVQYRCMGGGVTLTFEAKDIKDLIVKCASLEEILGESTCGACQSPNVKFRHRRHDGNDFYEVRCQDCASTLSFGQKKEGGGLFPKRKDKEGIYLSNNGWVKWERGQQSQPTQGEANQDAEIAF